MVPAFPSQPPSFLPHLAQPAGAGTGDAVHLCPFTNVFSLSWLTQLPRIAEDDEIYAKRKKGPGGQARGSEGEREMGCLPRDAHGQPDRRRPEPGPERLGGNISKHKGERERERRLELRGFVKGELVDPK